MAAYSLMMHRMDQNERLRCEGISGTSKHLLDQNTRAFDQINTNLSTYKHERYAWLNEPNALAGRMHK